MAIDRDLLLQHFSEVWPVHNRGFAALLIECRRHFGGDMEQLLILAVIGDRGLYPKRVRDLTFGDWISGASPHCPPRPINTQSIADSTGIPRETVRRKVDRLIQRGWVERRCDRGLAVTQRAAKELAPATEATLDYLIALANVFQRVASTVPAPERLSQP